LAIFSVRCDFNALTRAINASRRFTAIVSPAVE
jgi:hypothetical protein